VVNPTPRQHEPIEILDSGFGSSPNHVGEDLPSDEPSKGKFEPEKKSWYQKIPWYVYALIVGGIVLAAVLLAVGLDHIH
jgi:hypothetical protein